MIVLSKKHFCVTSKSSSSTKRHRSRSPMSSRRRHVGSRDNPPTSRCLGIFGLSTQTEERDLQIVFAKYGKIEDVQIVFDAQSGRSRGFAFIYFDKKDDALRAKNMCNGTFINNRQIRVDFSITKRAHTPTPGYYMGRNENRSCSNKSDTHSYRDRVQHNGRSYRSHRRSPSPYYRRRDDRSRRYSRSRSPQRRSYRYY